MKLTRFKAAILNVNRPPLELPDFNEPIDNVFEFSKNRIHFNKSQRDKHLILEPSSTRHATSKFKDGIKYSFDKVYDNNDNLRFQITVGNNNYSSFIKLGWWDKIICNCIHGRYIITREWLAKTFIATIIGFLFALIGSTIGYRQGYQNGLKEGKFQSQDTSLLQ
jgi:hypothetical protein